MWFKSNNLGVIWNAEASRRMLVGEMFRENICIQIDSACLCISKFRIQYQVCECNTSRWRSTVEGVMLETIFVLSFKI